MQSKVKVYSQKEMQEDCATSTNGDVRSTAVVKFSAVESPTRYTQLSSNTDLNQPPSNWLRETEKLQGKWTESSYRSSHGKIFTSFYLANNFPDCVSKVDVISDAENIKKLLKIPYGKSDISMVVHRIGNALLLDEFDIHKHLFRESQKQFDWLRKFYFEQVLQSQEVEYPMLKKKKSREYLQKRNMFSKFLYYSLGDSRKDENKETTDMSVSSQEKPKGGAHDSLKNAAQPVVADMLKETEEQVESGSHKFLRNVLWTFEDIRMLIGSDVPAFSGETYPAVNLKLGDMKKPISVLTGMDYWLDNLMCNIPEVVMCLHENGIVKKYELTKTEDIPQMKNSQFSPIVVKDIALNIVSFLKSNATKSSHTYWLYKGKDDDVVKLYDLTALCVEAMGEKDQNPFSLPTAMLLYRVACNIKEGPESSRKQGTIYQLLKNCLCVLGSNENLQVKTSVHHLLSKVFVPSGIDTSFVHSDCPSGDSDDEKNYYEDQKSEDLSSVPVDCKSPSLAVNLLCRPNKGSDVFSGTDKMIPPLSKNWEERCIASLGHIVEGFKCIINVEENPNAEDSNVKNASADVTDSNISAFEPEAKSSWKLYYKIRLLQEVAQTYCALAEIANSSKRYGAAMRFIKLGLLCYERAKKVVISHCNKWPMEFLAYLLSLAGDVLFMLHHKDFGNNDPSLRKEYDSLEQVDLDVINILERNFGELDASNLGYNWACAWPANFEESLKQSSQAYEVALRLWPEKLADRKESLKKKCGSIFMEFGVWYMNQANEMLKDNTLMLKDNTGEINKRFSELFNESLKYFENGIASFQSINDTANAALLNSSIGQLMRIAASASSIAECAKKEFSSQERHYLNEAISYYSKALSILGNPKDFLAIQDSVKLELSNTLFNMGCLLLDKPPLSSCAQKQVEKEVCDLWTRALKLGEAKHSPERVPVFQYLAANIHHRLGSLYYNALRNQADNEQHKKQLRTLSDTHYGKSCAFLSSSEHCSEFFTVLMERIDLWERHLAEMTGFPSRQKIIYQIMNYMVTARPVLQNLIKKTINAKKVNKSTTPETVSPLQQSDVSQCASLNDDEAKKARQNLLTTFYERLKVLVKDLVKGFSAKASKNAKQLKKWNKVSSVVVKPPTEGCLEEYLCKVLGHLQGAVPQSN